MINNNKLKNIELNIWKQIYEQISEFYEKSNSALLQIEKEMENLIYKMYSDTMAFKKDDTLMDILQEKIRDTFLESLENCKIYKKEFNRKRYDLLTSYCRYARDMASSKKEYDILMFRCINVINNQEKMLDVFSMDIVEEINDIYFRQFDEIDRICNEFLELLERKIDNTTEALVEEEKLKELVNEVVTNNKLTISKSNSFDHKQVRRLAEENGYEYKWTNGSHKIYEHKNTHKIVVIPSHTLGFGLSKDIQKQIRINSI